VKELFDRDNPSICFNDANILGIEPGITKERDRQQLVYISFAVIYNIVDYNRPFKRQWLK